MDAVPGLAARHHATSLASWPLISQAARALLSPRAMPSHLGRLTVLAAITILFVGPPKIARACSCAIPPSPVEAAKGAQAVFEGKRIRRTVERAGDRTYARLDFEVLRVFKGTVTSTIDVYTSTDGATCGLDLASDGTSYLVYAYLLPSDSILGLPAGKLTTNLCSRTRPSSNAAEDFTALGPASAPVPGEPPHGGAGPQPDGGDRHAAPMSGAAGCSIGNAGRGIDLYTTGLWLLVMLARRAVTRRR